VTTDDRVVERLRACDDPHADRLLQWHVDDGIDTERLSYEDVATPMRLTGGKVCLGCVDAREGHGYAVRLYSDGYYRMHDGTNTGPVRWFPKDVQRDLSDPHTVNVLVPVEETPFAEVA